MCFQEDMMGYSDQDNEERVKKTDENSISKAFNVLVVGQIFAASLNAIIGDLPKWINIANVSLVSIVMIVIFIRGKRKAIKKSGFIIGCIMFSIIWFIIAYLLIIRSPYVYRIPFSLLCIFGIIGIYVYYDQNSIHFKIIRNLVLICFLAVLLQMTYIENLFSYPLNTIAKYINGKPIVAERITEDRWILGLYTSSDSWHGKYISADGIIYEGYFVDNELNGDGKITFDNGSIWEGQFVDGNLNGEGKKTFASGNVWEGQFVDDKLNGEGKITFSNGSIWGGRFIDGNLNGEGKKTFSSGSVWEGQFVDDKLNGEGKITFSDGNIWEGNFVDNKLNGEGKMTCTHGCVWEGYFVDNEFVGKDKANYAKYLKK
jgi:hypothetical protein